MKSILFLAGLAAAVPMLDKRAVVTKEIIETVWTTTTVWIDPTAAPSNIFAEYNVGGKPSSAAAVPTSAPAPPPSQAPAPPAPVNTPAPAAPVVNVYTPPAPVDTPKSEPTQAASSGGGKPGGTNVRTTYYNVEMGLTSCGKARKSSEHIAALRPENMPNTGNPNNSPSCGKQIRVTNVATGVSIVATVDDTCPDCLSVNDVDLSTSAMAILTPDYLTVGTIKTNWEWI